MMKEPTFKTQAGARRFIIFNIFFGLSIFYSPQIYYKFIRPVYMKFTGSGK